jgi:hypothetical protein
MLKGYAFADRHELIHAWKLLLDLEKRRRADLWQVLSLLYEDRSADCILSYLAGPASTLSSSENIYNFSEAEWSLLPESWRAFDNLMLFLHLMMTFEQNKPYSILHGHLFGKCVRAFVEHSTLEHLFYVLTSLAVTQRVGLHPGITLFLFTVFI